MDSHKTLPKAQRTRGLSSTYQSNFFGSYHKFKHKSWSNIFRISTLHQLQNLNQTSPFRQNLNLKILTKPNQNLDQEWTSYPQPTISSKIMTKLQLQNLAWTSTSKSWPNLETLCSKSEQKLNFMTKLHLPNLHKTVVNTNLIINLSNSNNLNKFWVVIFTCQGHINQVC